MEQRRDWLAEAWQILDGDTSVPLEREHLEAMQDALLAAVGERARMAETPRLARKNCRTGAA
ncbi:MAG: hypothetical protein ACRD2O_00195 [Terriglobia bacterium]